MNDFLISLQDVQNYLTKQGYNAPTNINSDNILQQLREAALDRITSYLGYKFISNSYTDERYDGNDAQLIYTRHRPVTTINSVKINDAEYSLDNFEIFQDGRAIFYNGGLFIGDVKLSYQAGYTRTTMPASIRLAALKLCALWYNAENREGITSEAQQDGSSKSFDFTEENILSSIYQYKAMVW